MATLFLIISPFVQGGAILAFDFCEITNDIFNSEAKFN